jgi:heme exporter protein C
VVPADLNQGDAQRVMYVHVGSAWLGELSFGLAALAGLGYLWRRDLRFDAVANSAVEVGVLFTAFAIWGGMMWGKPVWGVFWQWEDPRLATTALLLLLGIGYLLLRRLSDDPARRASRAAVVGLIAALDIPIIHFSVIWWRGLHQGASFIDPAKSMKAPVPTLFVAALLFMLTAFTLTWVYLLIRRYQLARLESRIEEEVRLSRIKAARAAATAPPGVPVEEAAG